MAEKLNGRKLVLFIVLPGITIAFSIALLTFFWRSDLLAPVPHLRLGREISFFLLLVATVVGCYFGYRPDPIMKPVYREAFRVGGLFVGAVAVTLLFPGSYQSIEWTIVLTVLESVALLTLLMRVGRYIKRGPKLLLAGLWVLVTLNGVSALTHVI
ncbi:hypothetical protein [Niveispirillum sp.]|uniref:hypothetical protein n=1 Tax=Niveispirillum sp. TaxID=1917217 RepID=UPI001B716F0C|nr:hypothetical protein [Niveispirillum sp.]MBP7338725.1 hypothetical protein [Niveispirillum sp.]